MVEATAPYMNERDPRYLAMLERERDPRDLSAERAHGVACTLCRRVMPRSELVAKHMLDVAYRSLTHYYCKDVMGCLDALRAWGRV